MEKKDEKEIRKKGNRKKEHINKNNESHKKEEW